MCPEALSSRIERERRYHNSLETLPLSVRVLRTISGIFYDKGEEGILYTHIWKQLDLHGKTVLDYGCGGGEFGCGLAQRGAKVYGIDISDYLVSCAQMKARNEKLSAEFSVRDAHETEYPSGSFDYVFGNGILHHLDLQRAYREIARVLKPGGTAIFMEPLAGHPLLRVVRWATPSARTPDEKPMTFADIEVSRQEGLNPNCRYHFFMSVAAAPFLLFGNRTAKSVLRGFDRADQLLFQTVPATAGLAWYAVIRFRKPEAQTIANYGPQE